MKRSGIINSELSRAIASLGHGDILMIVDAGFPIPSTAWRIDLAIVPNVPDLATVYAAIAPELFVDKIMIGNELADRNKPLLATLKKWFDERDLSVAPYEEILGPLAKQAKVIVRSGAMDPWGNAAIVCGVDYKLYFSKPDIVVPDGLKERLSRRDLPR